MTLPSPWDWPPGDQHPHCSLLMKDGSLDGAGALGGVWEGKIGRAASGPRESAAVTSSQQSQLRSEDSEPGRPRRSVRWGTGEEEEVGVGGAAPQITSENLAAIWLPHWPPGCAAAVPFAQTLGTGAPARGGAAAVS